MLAIMGFLGFLNVYAMRVNLSVAMVCMINQTAIHSAPATDAPTTGHDKNTSIGGSGAYNLTYVNDSVNGLAAVTEKNGGGSGDQGSEVMRCGIQTGNSSLSASEVRSQTENIFLSGAVLCP